MRNFDYSKIQERDWDTETLNYVSLIHEAKGRQSVYLSRKTLQLDRLVEIAKVQSTEASNAIEGIRTTETRLRQLMSEKTTPRNRDESEIAGYRDALNVIHNSFEYIPLTPNYILQLHKIMFSHTDSAFGGTFKNVQNYISAVDENGKRFILFTPPAPYETPSAVRKICDEYNLALSDGKTDPLLLIPVFIHDFLCIHPFIDGNGRMSRLLTTLLLYRSGYEVGRYISLEAKISESKDAYYDSLEQSQVGWNEGTDDCITFTKYLLGTVISAYRDFDDRIKIVSGSSAETVENAVGSRIGKFSKREILELCPNLSPATVERKLRAMVENGKLEMTGQGRNTVYIRKQ